MKTGVGDNVGVGVTASVRVALTVDVAGVDGNIFACPVGVIVGFPDPEQAARIMLRKNKARKEISFDRGCI